MREKQQELLSEFKVVVFDTGCAIIESASNALCASEVELLSELAGAQVKRSIRDI